MSNNLQTTATTKTLEELGLGQNEAVLYEILLKTMDASIPYLLKNSSFSRTMLYYILGNLESFGLIKAEKKGKKTVYNVEPPEKLAEMVEDRAKEFHKQKDLLHDAMGDLYSTYRLAHNKPGVKFFEGLEGFKTVTNDSLKAQGEILTFLDVDATQKYASGINQEYVKERIKKGIPKRQIAVDTPFTRARYKNYSPLLEVRLMPPAVSPFKTSVQIYNNTVSFSTLNDKKMIGVIVEDEQIAQLHRSLFEYVWHTLPALPSAQNKPSAPATPDKKVAQDKKIEPAPAAPQSATPAKEPTLQEKMLSNLGSAPSDSK